MTLILKGGGYSLGVRHMIGVPARHHHWTGTNDDVPRSSGAPPLDGGLPKPPNLLIRFVRWVKYYARWGKYRAQV